MVALLKELGKSVTAAALKSDRGSGCDILSSRTFGLDMPATTTIREFFPKASTTLAQAQYAQSIRMKAGAIRSSVDSTSDANNYVLVTEWNVIGENDP
jgi:hypothetical protein